MKRLFGVLIVSLVFAGTARGDMITGSFGLSSVPPPPGVAPWATYSLLLNADNTITGHVAATQAGYTILGFFFDTDGIDKTTISLDSGPAGWGYASIGAISITFGFYEAGIVSDVAHSVSVLDFTLSAVGGFTSVHQLERPGAPSLVAHVVWRTDTGGQLQDATIGEGSVVPEPASLLLLGSGLAGAAMARRKRR